MADLKAALIADVNAAQEALSRKVAAIADADWPRESANEGWTNKDLLAHLACIDGRLRSQVPCVFGRQPWPADTIDEYNEREVGRRRSATVADLLDELAGENGKTLAFLESLSEAELSYRFDHPRRGSVSLDEWLRIIPNHIVGHLDDFRAG